MLPWIILALSISSLSLTRGEDATSISIRPSNRMRPGKSATIICKIAPRWNTNTIFWWRKIGGIQIKIGNNALMSSSFENNNRYQASAYGQEDGVSYGLIISSLRAEDTGEIGCSVRGSTEKPSFVTLAVCEDIENQACLCIARTGFGSPACYDKDPSIAAWEGRYNMATTGLGVCLAIAILYGLVMSVLVGWDCIARLKADRKRKQELVKMRQSHDPSMYNASEDVQLHPNDSASDVNVAPSKPRMDKGRSYNQITTEAVAHTNQAYNPDDDISYQELDKTSAVPPSYNNYKPYSAPPGVKAAGAMPSPRPLDTYDASRYGPSPHSPDGPRAPHDGLYANPPNANHAPQSQSPGVWSTQSANAAGPGAFRYPDPNSKYGNGDVSPRYAQPSPRNAYSERPPVRNPQYQREPQHLQPRQLYFREPKENGPSATPQGPYQDSYDDYGEAGETGGAYIDNTGLSV